MKKAVIIYHSRTGTTMKYAQEIGAYLNEKQIDVQVTSTSQYTEGILDDAEYIFFGCWTSGLFVILQKPEKAWINFVKRLPRKLDAKIALFTTYKILTGSMFRNMDKYLERKFAPPSIELKSRSSSLTDQNKQALDQFVS